MKYDKNTIDAIPEPPKVLAINVRHPSSRKVIYSMSQSGTKFGLKLN